MTISPSRPEPTSIAGASKALFSDDRFTVSPSWLSVDNSRYAIRTVAKLEFKTAKPSLGVHYAFIAAGVLLMLYSAYHFGNDGLSLVVRIFMFMASMAICVVFGCIVFNAKTSHHLQVTFIDGSKLPITMHNVDQANKLLDNLTKAMDWHTNGDVVPKAQRGSHVRKGYAVSSWEDEDLPSNYERATRNSQEHPTRVERRSAQMVAALRVAMKNKWRK